MGLESPVRAEEILKKLVDEHVSGCFLYTTACESFRAVAARELGCHCQSHGIYIIRALVDSRILYIGKGGSINRDGAYRSQGIYGRMTNTRNNNASANEWFRDVVAQYGDLQIEFVVLDSTTLVPGYIEAILLQAFLNDFGRLPALNRLF